MDYQEARAAFFQPRADDAPPARIADWDSPARRLRDAIEPIATICFWSQPAYEQYAARGLDFLLGYVWGRASVLGEPEPTVVASAFAVFEPGLIAALYDDARRRCPLADVRAAKETGAVTALRTVLGEEPDGLAETAGLLRGAAEAADPTGRPLHAGLAALPWPEHPLGQVWHACSILREHRGDGHVAAFVAARLTGLQANLMTELRVGWEPLTYTASRGWSEEAMTSVREELASRGLVDGDGLTETGRLLRDDVERSTDRLLDPVVAAVGEDLPALLDRLGAWSQRIVDHGWFPPDPYKRVSG